MDIEKKSEKEKYPEGFVNVLNGNKKLIEDLIAEENKERVETFESVVNRMTMDKNVTDNSKNKFISEMKSGLGVTIKERPNTVTFIKRPWYKKILKFIKNVFDKI